MTVTSQSLPRLDPMGRCQSLASVWPELQALVITEFNNYWSASETYINRYRHRREAFHDLAKPGLPEPLHLGWEHEVFEVCLQSVLASIPIELWKRGEPSDEAIELAADIAIPDVRMDIALELSHCTRPPLTRPSEVSNAVLEPQPIDNENEMEGWIRIGYQEDELLSDSSDTRQKFLITSAYMGLAAEDSHEEVMDVKIPFANAGGAELWRDVDPELAYLIPHLRGGLVSASFYAGFTTRFMLLACHPFVSAAMGLHPSGPLAPLQMLDQEGNAAVILRVWKSEAVDANVAGCIYRLTGCDLLMRIDCFTKLSQLLQSRLMLVYRSGRYQHE